MCCGIVTVEYVIVSVVATCVPEDVCCSRPASGKYVVAPAVIALLIVAENVVVASVHHSVAVVRCVIPEYVVCPCPVGTRVKYVVVGSIV